MGVIHKLLPKVKDFIISQKQANPAISCRKLSHLIHSRFKLYLSKSSISAVLKSANLSSRVGRPEKPVIHKPEKPQVLDNVGCIFLKAADLESGLIGEIAKFICLKFPGIDERSLKTRSELLTFLPVFVLPNLQALQNYSGEGLWTIISRRYKYPFLLREIEKMPNIQPIANEIVIEIECCLRGVDYLKITLSHGDILYLDPQFRSLWQNQQVPGQLSLSVSKITSYIESLFMRNAEPIVLRFGPDFPDALSSNDRRRDPATYSQNKVAGKSIPAYFLDFISSLEAKPQKRIVKISLYSENQEIERFTPEPAKKRNFIIGFLPRQISRLIPSKAWNFKRITIDAPERQEFYIDFSTIEITQHNIIQSITLNICLIKQNLAQEPGLCLLTNYSEREKSWEDIVRLYFQRWPGYPPEFEYMKAPAKISKEPGLRYPNLLYINKLDIIPERQDLSWLYTGTLETLSCYAQHHFFPQGYASFDFHSMWERFYQISGKITPQKGSLVVDLIPQPGFPWQRDFLWQKDLHFACQKVNQANIFSPKKERIWLRFML